jgi:hypothetical protein
MKVWFIERTRWDDYSRKWQEVDIELGIFADESVAKAEAARLNQDIAKHRLDYDERVLAAQRKLATAHQALADAGITGVHPDYSGWPVRPGDYGDEYTVSDGFEVTP